uniref:Sodium/glutamate symporter n=1 Tax=Sexangularia sp. CB-2014 TaxID=1486929 RepID=A0A7S1V886_9EUKA
MSFISTFIAASILLLVGKIVRFFVRPLQLAFVPSSVVGGLLGLLATSLAAGIPQVDTAVDAAREVPGILINIVFASMFLGTTLPKVQVLWGRARPNFLYGMSVAWSQWFIATLFTAAVLIPVFHRDLVPPYFTLIIPLGFAGGHGTAAALGALLEKEPYNWIGATDVALAAATVGLVSSVCGGTLLVSIGLRMGCLTQVRMVSSLSRLTLRGVNDPADRRPIAGFQTVSSDSIDVLALHLAIVGVAIGLGAGLQALLALAAPVFGTLPLFVYAMIGGLVLQLIIQRVDRQLQLVDGGLLERISGAALDYLVVSAMASVRISAVRDALAPFLALCVVCIVWNMFMVLVVARQLIGRKNHFFEHAIAVYGQALGIVAAGLMLLRIVDPQAKTPVPAAFGLKQLLHSPFMGGGLFTALSLPLMHNLGIWPMVGLSGGVAALFWTLSICTKDTPLDDLATATGGINGVDSDGDSDDDSRGTAGLSAGGDTFDFNPNAVPRDGDLIDEASFRSAMSDGGLIDDAF